jgi:hypothetical protein
LGQRAYLAAVAALGLWVGICCYFDPSQADRGIPWPLPTLCATFLGSMYLSGGIGLAASLVSRRWAEIRSIIPMIAIWTGGLTFVSLFYLNAFPFERLQTWVWFAAYIAYPLIGIGFLWRHRDRMREHPRAEAMLPTWVKAYLAAQGVIMIALSAALLFAAPLMQALWPWKTGVMMLQLYSQPFLAYGIGSLILSRQQAWSEIRNSVFAMGIFTGAELLASLRFLPLFDGTPLSIALWIGSQAVASIMLCSLAARAFSLGHLFAFARINDFSWLVAAFSRKREASPLRVLVGGGEGAMDD